MSRVPDFMRWLNAVANRLLGPFDPRHDDCVNEGAIAMWRAEETADKNRTEGEVVAYMINAAEMRMKEFAWRDRPAFGHAPMRGSRPAEEVAILDALTDNLRDDLSPVMPDIADFAMQAYHRGEILRALECLTPRQRQCAQAIMAGHVLSDTQRGTWKNTKPKLRAKLAHLAC